MGFGDFLGRLGRSLQGSVDDLRYQRDWGPHYKERFAAEQDYLNRMADEKAAKEERERRRQDEADTRAAAIETRAARDDAEKRFEGNAKALAGLGAPQESGSFLFPDPVQMGLARDKGEGDQLLERARRAALAGRASKDETAAEKARKEEEDFAREVKLAGIRANLQQTAADAAATRAAKAAEAKNTPSNRYAQYLEQARKNVSTAISSERIDPKTKSLTDEQVGQRVQAEQDRLAGLDPALADFLGERIKAATSARVKSDTDRLNDTLLRALRGESVAPPAPVSAAAPTAAPGNDEWTTLPDGVKVRKKS